jgi:hypothetical protein
VGGAGGQASGHRGVVVELKDGAAAPDEDPRQPAIRSAPTAAKPDGTRHWLAAATWGGKREVTGDDRSARQRGGMDEVSEERLGGVGRPL